MELEIIKQLIGVSPLVGLLAILTYKLWEKLNLKEKELMQLYEQSRMQERDNLKVLIEINKVLEAINHSNIKNKEEIIKELERVKEHITIIMKKRNEE